MTPGSRERRAAARVLASAGRWSVRARLRSGHEARVIDVSGGGTLIECDHRLVPGARVALQIFFPDNRFELEGSVVRAEVTELCKAGVRYRGAIRFDREADGIMARFGIPGGKGPSHTTVAGG